MTKAVRSSEHLTQEWLRKRVRNNFQLTRQAIELGRFYIHAGHEIHLQEILEEIERHPEPDYVATLESLEDEEPGQSS